jgi:phosphopantothenoylcysteine decarboxylase/phosphopantothenate--cysteine ligase
MQLKGKKIILGITASIAAYKSVQLVRLLVQHGAEVQVLLTPDALAFVSPLTLSVLAQRPILHSFTANDGTWNNHVALGLWADLFVIAPASANTLAKMANGLCDNLLLATYLSARCPIWLAPAMDLDMYEHPSTQRNLKTLQTYPKHHIEESPYGVLASGLEGKGRMQEVEVLFANIEKFFAYGI